MSLLSGVLTGLAFDFPWSGFLVWFSLVGFFQAIAKTSFKQGLLAALIFGLAYNLTVIFWIFHVTFLGLFALVSYLSLYTGLFFLISRYFFKKPLKIISLPCLWVITEFLKENIWTGFGWANLGYSQYQNLYLIQAADIAGVKLISFLIVLTNVFIWEAVVERVKLKKIFFMVFVFLTIFTYSFYRLDSLKETGSKKVSLIQPNIPQESKWEAMASSSIINTLKVLGGSADKDSLLIFPEAAWPQIIKDKQAQSLFDFANAINRELLIGGVLEEGGEFYNAALLFNRITDYDQDIVLTNSYRKIKLVPFGEYVPLRNVLSFINVLNTVGDISSGKDLTKFSHHGVSFATLICFEDVLPIYVSQIVHNNDFLVNITNDAWFEGNPQARQHLAIMVFRAVENRIAIVRAANTGISGWVSFQGKLNIFQNQGQEVFFPGVKVFSVSLYNKRPFYTVGGELFPIFCGIFLLGIFIRDGLKREVV